MAITFLILTHLTLTRCPMTCGDLTAPGWATGDHSDDDDDDNDDDNNDDNNDDDNDNDDDPQTGHGHVLPL